MPYVLMLSRKIVISVTRFAHKIRVTSHPEGYSVTKIPSLLEGGSASVASTVRSVCGTTGAHTHNDGSISVACRENLQPRRFPKPETVSWSDLSIFF